MCCVAINAAGRCAMWRLSVKLVKSQQFDAYAAVDGASLCVVDREDGVAVLAGVCSSSMCCRAVYRMHCGETQGQGVVRIRGKNQNNGNRRQGKQQDPR